MNGATVEKALEKLRREQAARAMPLVSQLLECWDQVPLDAKQQIAELAPGAVGNILALQSVMEG
jgi:hypothetical protein